jgi:hypothetical protein
MRISKLCTVIVFGLLAMAARSSASGQVCEQRSDLLLAPTENVCPAFDGQGCTGTSIVAPTFVQHCLCKGPRQTQTYTGTGSSCGAADQDVFNQANSHVICNATTDGLCWESWVIVTTPCFLNAATGLYQEAGHVDWKCPYC